MARFLALFLDMRIADCKQAHSSLFAIEEEKATTYNHIQYEKFILS